MNQCPPGQCAIDIKTGFKRCPGSVRSKLVYNELEEACTRVNFCDFKSLPYAVKSDGSSENSICEASPDGTKIPCRCTNKKTCSSYQLSKFTILEEKTKRQGERDLTIYQDPITEQEEIGYAPVTINNPAEEFCQINPGFTDILRNGCNLTNSLQDRLGCQQISTIGVEKLLSYQIPWKLSEDISIGMISLNLESSSDDNLSLPNSGILIFTGMGVIDDGSSQKLTVETIKYEGRSPVISSDNSESINFNVTLANIVSISLVEDGKQTGIPDANGFQFAWLSEKEKRPNITLSNATVEFCSYINSTPNYKNMMICTQKDNNICKFGSFSYNFDKLRGVKDNRLLPSDESFSRNFCQFNLGDSIINQKPDYLRDPEYYTLSCAIGSGCNGKNLGKNPQENSRDKYFPDVDINGINGVWEIKLDNFPTVDFKDPLLLNNNTIQPGDFWSIKFINQNLLSTDKDTPKDSSIIEVTDLFGLGIYVNTTIPDNPKLAPRVGIGTSFYTLKAANFTLENNKNVSSIEIDPPLESDLPGYSDIRITPPNIKSEDTYGIVTIDNSKSSINSRQNLSNYSQENNYVLKTLNGLSIPGFDGIKTDVTIYKQFAFSGPNYVTKVRSINPTKHGNQRVYTNGDGTDKDYDLGGETRTQLLPPENIYQLGFTSQNKTENLNLHFYSPEAPFKTPMSMYYPVWNPVLFQQECIRCKPFLLASVELNSSQRLSNIIIQFCGKDFKNYQYNARDKNYCYTSTSEINFDNTQLEEITSQRIILKEPNTTVQVGDYVLDSSLQLPFIVEPSEGNNWSFEDFSDNFFRYQDLQIVPQIVPTGWVDHGDKSMYSNNMNYIGTPEKSKISYPVLFGVEESTSENFYLEEDNIILKSNLEGEIVYNDIEKKWDFISGMILPLNYFFGKKYQDSFKYNKNQSGQGSEKDRKFYNNGFYFIPLQKVRQISDDRKTIILDSPYPYKIKQDELKKPIYVQFCRLDSPLKLKLTNSAGGEINDSKIEINAISDSRITDIKITSNKTRFLENNLPLVKIDTENQIFL